jgi:hypothetical protein
MTSRAQRHVHLVTSSLSDLRWRTSGDAEFGGLACLVFALDAHMLSYGPHILQLVSSAVVGPNCKYRMQIGFDYITVFASTIDDFQETEPCLHTQTMLSTNHMYEDEIQR